MLRYIDIHTHSPRLDVTSPTMAGIHPWDAEKSVEMPQFEGCDFVGETGLDYASSVDKLCQEELFRAHLAIATELHKPVVLHVVKAVEQTLKILDEYSGIEGVVFHSFIGSWQQAERCLQRGYYLSFGRRSLASTKTRSVIAKMPIEWLFCETDNTSDSDSIRIEDVYAEVAAIRCITIEELCGAIEKNYSRLFTKY